MIEFKRKAASAAVLPSLSLPHQASGVQRLLARPWHGHCCRYATCPIQDQRTRHLIGQPRQGRRSGSEPYDTTRDPNGPEAECELRDL
jgi:hypothetical protein